MDRPPKLKIKSQKLKVKETLRNNLIKIAKTIQWIPGFGLERELDWLKNMHDWLISKKRYWGLALPIFECGECGNFEVIGSKEELKQRAVEGWEKFAAPLKRGEPRPDNLSGREGHSPHRPWVDNVKIKCSKCQKVISRILDVGNPWLDAGIVPFSTLGYYADKKYWKRWFPAELVCESFPGQFKNWFYAIITMSAVLENVAPVKTIFGYALVRDEKGEEMHKSKGNAIWFDDAVERIGADPMRWLYAKQNPEYNLNFGYDAAEETKRKLLTLYNIFTFFTTYVDKKDFPEKVKLNSDNILDCWIISKLNNLVEIVSKNLDTYNASGAAIALEDFFVNDLSLWYLRRSRERFHAGAKNRDKAIETLYFVLLNLTKLFAPIMPFFAEETYQTLRSKDMPESIHLCDWPKTDKKKINERLEKKMETARAIVALALAERAQAGIKIRQPIASLKIKNQNAKIKIDGELLDLLKDEVNVKKIIFDSTINKEIELDTIITEELEKEGIKREIIRSIRSLRKELKLSPQRVITGITSTVAVVLMGMKEEELLKEAGAKQFTKAEKESDMNVDVKKAVKIGNKIYQIGLEK